MPSLVAWIHIAQVALILQVVGVAAISKFVIANPPVGRTGMMVFGVVSFLSPSVRSLYSIIDANPDSQSAKSLVIIAYQVFSKKFNKWYSLKANAILNCLEVLFWAAVVFMGVQSHLQSCNGIQCTLGWTVSGLGAVNW